MEAVVELAIGLLKALIWATLAAILSLINWLFYGIRMATSPSFRADQRAHYKYTPFVKAYMILSAMGTIVLVFIVVYAWVWLSRDKREEEAIVFEHTSDRTEIRIDVDVDKVKGFLDNLRDKLEPGDSPQDRSD